MQFEEFFETKANFDWVDTDNISEKLNKLGISLTDDKGNYRSFKDVLEEMSMKFNENIKNNELEGENEMKDVIIGGENDLIFKERMESAKNMNTINTVHIINQNNKCPNCGSELTHMCYTTNPPQHETKCFNCGYTKPNTTSTIDLEEVKGEHRMKLQVRYIDKNITPMQKIDGGDLVDLRVSRVFKNGEETTFPCEYQFGDTLFFKLGFAMKMPPNKKANVYPRSGMFKNYGFLLTNSVGQIDNKFQGNDDEWCAMMWCTRNGKIDYDDRILQFEVVDRVMENVEFEIVEQLGDVNRGGYSSTGVR